MPGYADLGLKVAVTEADMRTFVNDATEQAPIDHPAAFAQPYEVVKIHPADATGRCRRAGF